VTVTSLMHLEPSRSLRDLDRLSSQLLSGTGRPLAMPLDVWREGQTYPVAPGPARRAGRQHRPASAAEHGDRDRAAPRPLRPAADSTPEPAGQDGQEQAEQAGGGQVQVLVADRPMGSVTRQLVLGRRAWTRRACRPTTPIVLHLTIPMAQQAQPRRIQVGQRGSGGGQQQVIEGSTGQAGGAPGHDEPGSATEKSSESP
jgi:HSP20 family protein